MGGVGIGIRFEKGCGMIREALTFLEVAVNYESMEVQMRKALSRLGKSGAGLRKEIALQKAFLDAASCYPVTVLTRKYFEKYRESGLGCLARNLVWTFDAQDAESVEEMKKRIRAAAVKYPWESFPDFSSYTGVDPELPLKGGRCSFLDSVRKAEIGEKFQARLIFAFQDLEGSLEELGELLEGALQILEPFRKEMEAMAGEKRAYWQSYFAKHTMEDFFALTGIYVDEKNYSQLLLRWELVNGIHMSLKMDEDQEADTLEILVGSLMNEEVIREWKKGGERAALALMADPVKMDILLYVSQTPHFGREVAEHFGLTTATISYHMQELVNEGLIDVRQQGKRLYYSLNGERVREVLDRTAQQLLG